MNSGATAERIYDELKRRIMVRAFRPGARLDASVLADTLAASATPVREALHQLVGEQLVETRTGGGFHLPAWDEPGLKDLYDWSEEVLLLAVRRWTSAPAARRQDTPEAIEPIADRIGALFLAIARRSLNGEHARTIDLLNARLHAARVVEPTVLDGTEAEADALAQAFDRSDSVTLRRLSSAYHRRRRRAAAAIVRMIYRPDVP